MQPAGAAVCISGPVQVMFCLHKRMIHGCGLLTDPADCPIMINNYLRNTPEVYGSCLRAYSINYTVSGIFVRRSTSGAEL